MQWLWKQFLIIYGVVRVRHNYGISDDGTWLDELFGKSRIDLERGIAALRLNVETSEIGDVYPVSCSEFKKLCIPTEHELGLPGEEKAYRLACRSLWDTHPIVYLAVGDIGTFRLRTLAKSRTRPWYGRNYRKLVARARMGERLLVPQNRKHILEHAEEDNTKSVITVPAKAKDHISVMRKMLNMRAKTKND